MNYKIVIKESAQADIAEAFSHFDRIGVHLGDRFLVRMEECLLRISSNPLMYAEVFDGVRKVRLRQFPYVVDYLVEDATIFVLGVQYGGRDPSNWPSRSS